eukprot:COSAG01_NODE_2687_length_7249_cov_105.374406_9_plen_342_part_00
MFAPGVLWGLPVRQRHRVWIPSHISSQLACLVCEACCLATHRRYTAALDSLIRASELACQTNLHINFQVFIHKVDGLSDDQKVSWRSASGARPLPVFSFPPAIFGNAPRIVTVHLLAYLQIGTQRDIQGEVLDALDQRGLTNCHPSFHLTSIYDHSILEAFSKVVQTLIPQRGLLDSLLDLLISTCRIEKAFLFDLVSKIYIATDSEPYHMQSYELCAEMIDVVLETAAIYGVDGQGSYELPRLTCGVDPSHISVRMVTVLVGAQCRGGSNGGSHDDQSFSVIKLSNGLVLCLREVDTHLGLVTMLREENFDRHGLLEFNFGILTQALSEAKRAPPSSQPT